MKDSVSLVRVTILVGLLWVFACTRIIAQTDVSFPSDVTLYNVKSAPYNAAGNGITDDTAAIQAAITAALTNTPNRYGAMNIIYIPNGTYIISGTLKNRIAITGYAGWAAGLYIQGQSQAGTILQLANNAPGFSNAAAPAGVIQTRSESPNKNAAKSISSLTRLGTTATATVAAHGYATGEVVTVVGATQTQYNGSFFITVVDANTFTYTVSGTPATPATGTITVYDYNGGGNQAFRHYIRNLTINTGTGNAGAAGIDFLVSNRGGIFNVTVTSSDTTATAPYTGVMMDTSWPGPGMLKNVTVNGFETGISMRSQSEYCMTFEHITLNNQLTYGMDITSNTATIRALTSVNTVPVIHTGNANAHVTLLDSTFTGGLSGSDAITGYGGIFVRNLSSAGYGTVVQNSSGGATVAGNGATPVVVSEYKSLGPYAAFSDDISTSLDLPIAETPDYNTTDLSLWINGAPNGVNATDNLATIQAAIDTAGKTVVYLPVGLYFVSNTIHLRGSIQKFLGCNAFIKPTSGFPNGVPIIEFDGGTAPYTDIQNFRVSGSVEQNSSQTLCIENCDIMGYNNTSTGAGNVFTEDTISGVFNMAYPQSVWARQMDIEGQTSSFITNNGGVLWLFGYKTEYSPLTGGVAEGSLLTNENSAWTELIGGFFYPLGSTTPTVPAIINNNAYLTANFQVNILSPVNWPTLVQDTEGSATVNFTPKMMTGSSNSKNCPLFSGATKLPSRTYTEWSDQYFNASQQADPTVSGLNSTPQTDGVPNLLKYFFNINPSQPMTSTDRAALPAVGTATTGGTQYLTLHYRSYALSIGITCNVQTSPDLLTWTTESNPAISQTGTDPNTGDPLLEVQVPLTNDAEFLRLDLTSP